MKTTIPLQAESQKQNSKASGSTVVGAFSLHENARSWSRVSKVVGVLSIYENEFFPDKWFNFSRGIFLTWKHTFLKLSLKSSRCTFHLSKRFSNITFNNFNDVLTVVCAFFDHQRQRNIIIFNISFCLENDWGIFHAPCDKIPQLFWKGCVIIIFIGVLVAKFHYCRDTLYFCYNFAKTNIFEKVSSYSGSLDYNLS